MKIAGLDICNGYAVAWILEEFPADPRKFYNPHSAAQSRKKDSSFVLLFSPQVYC